MGGYLVDSMTPNHHAVFDIEIIGLHDPVFLVCTKIVETGKRSAFWYHKPRHVERLIKMLNRTDLTWISFNGIKFDAPLVAAWVTGQDIHAIKELATRIIRHRLQPWDAYRLLGVKGLPIDHIDLYEVAPGVMISLKTYAGRMHSPSMIDMPYHHDHDPSEEECKVIEKYCHNDCDETERLFFKIRDRIALREMLGAQHGIDLRSKSDAQVAEAILKKATGMGKPTHFPSSVRYVAPQLIKTKNPELLDLIDRIEAQVFEIDKSGSPVLPLWLSDGLISFRDGP